MFVHNINDSPQLLLKWNVTGHFEEGFVSVTPPVTAGSIFNTTNTTLQVPILYNQEYNISVMAHNCAGNSTIVTISVNYGKFIVHLN